MNKLNLTKISDFIRLNYPKILIIFIVIFSFILNFYSIKNYGYGNEYYAASIHSMTKDLRNFFFCSFDPLGILSVDKAPIGLWVQTLFVMIGGYNGYMLILPQAICGSLSCFLIYIIVKRYLKSNSVALLSALSFCLTPIIVATSRNNTIDMQLIFVLLITSLFFLKFLDTKEFKYIILTSIFMGIGFNIKMLQAYLILPSIIITYLLYYKTKVKKKIIYGLSSLLVMISVSVSWPLIVSITPPSERPYIDSTSSNSIFELITGHNGMFRVIGKETLNSKQIASYNLKAASSDKNDDASLYQFNDYIGSKSIFRLFSQSIYGQVSWLIPYVLVFILILIKYIKKMPLIKKVFYIYFTSWFIVMYLLFSFLGFFHRYYLCVLAPTISILFACCFNLIAQFYHESIDKKKHLFLTCFIITIIIQLYNIQLFAKTPALLILITILMSFISVIFIIMYYNTKDKNPPKKSFITKYNFYITKTLCIISLLTAPAYWCITTILYVPNVTKPSAGPEIINKYLDINNTKGGVSTIKRNMDLEKYLLDNYKQGSFIIASAKSSNVSQLIIDTNLPALATNGFTGDINYISLDKFKKLIDNGQVRYFIIYNDDDSSNEITKYVQNNGTLIKENNYNPLPKKDDKILFNKGSIQKKYNFKLYYFNN